MALSKKQIKLEIKAEVSKAITELNKVEKEAKDVKEEVKKGNQALKSFGTALVAAFSTGVVASFSKEVTTLSARTKGLERGFLNFGRSVGLNENSLGKFRKATDGTVTDIDLMTAANNSMLLGIVESDDQFADLIDSAQRLSKAVGQDAKFGIDSLTTGIGRQSKLMLDNLGIIVDTNKAYEVYAKANDTSVGKMDDFQKKQAFIQATMESVRQKVSELGPEVLDLSDQYLIAENNTTLLKVAIGDQLTPIMTTAVASFNDAVTATTEFIKNLSPENIENIKRNAMTLGTLATGFLLVKGAALLAKNGMLGFIRASKFLLIFEAVDLVIANVVSNFQFFKNKIKEVELAILEFSTGPIGTALQNIPGFINPVAGAFQNMVDSIAGDESVPSAIQKIKEEIAGLEQVAFEFDWGNLAAMFGQLDDENVDVDKIIEDIKKVVDSVNDGSKSIADNESKTIKQSLESLAKQGKVTKSAAVGTIEAKANESIATYIASVMKLPFPANIIASGVASAVVGKLFEPLKQFQTGGSFITRGRTTLPNGAIVGDNASGMERVDVTPLPSPTSNNDKTIVININAPVVDEFVVDSIIPAIRRAEQLNL